MGVEPTLSAWKAGVLPLYDTRINTYLPLNKKISLYFIVKMK